MLAISVMGNRGTFTKSWKQILIDFDFVYHAGYVIVSLLGLCMHEFFYSLLVRIAIPSCYLISFFMSGEFRYEKLTRLVNRQTKLVNGEMIAIVSPPPPRAGHTILHICCVAVSFNTIETHTIFELLSHKYL